MGQYSVPCWCCSVKNVTVFASGSISVRFPVPVPGSDSTLPVHPHHNLTRSPWRLTATGGASVYLDNPLLESNLCRNGPISLQILPLPSSIRSSKGVHTFRKSRAHLREKYTRLLVKLQVNFTLGTGQRPSLAVGKSGHRIGTHFRENCTRADGQLDMNIHPKSVLFRAMFWRKLSSDEAIGLSRQGVWFEETECVV
jgi:hypothetical protein